jgi:DNA-binding PadR family transcriptional regulator
MKDALSSAELAVLSLLGEAPQHGYEIERLIEQRGLREWTGIGFSSIYFLLDKLRKRGLAEPLSEAAGGKARRPFAITEKGRQRLVEESLRALIEPARAWPGLLLGVANWPLVAGSGGVQALESRAAALRTESGRLEAARDAQQPLPPFVEAMFDYALGQIAADIEWTEHTRRKLSDNDGKD